MRLHIAGQRAALHLLDDSLIAQGGAAHRLVGIGGVLEMVEDNVIRRVIRLADLLQNHAALALQLLRHKGGIGQDIANDISGERHILLQHLAVIGGVFAGGIGVDLAPDILNLTRNGRRIPARSALEGHVFEEMRGAIHRRILMAGAGGDIGAEGDGLHPRHGLGDDGEAAGQGGDLDGIAGQGWVPEGIFAGYFGGKTAPTPYGG